MKKSCNPNDIHQEGQEQSKKLYRSISESARRLDDAHSCAQNVGDLFTPTLQIQRSRFQEYCERLIFADPNLFGRKAEELLWRKSYYDVISTAKKLKKKEYTPQEVCNIQTHINAGVGHYHHFISRLQYHYGLDLRNFVDFAIFKNTFKKSNAATQKPEQIDWAKQSVHRCLIYLGDLSRYMLEMYPNWDPSLAIRYYLKAVHFNPEYGIPHNQMGTLASSQNRILDAVYHYICCLSCKYPFDGTENNLTRLFEKNLRTLEQFPIEDRNADCIVQLEPAEHIKRLTARFLFLVETWFFNKNIADIYIVCHQTNSDLQECLSYTKPLLNDSDEIPTDADSTDNDSVLSLAYLSNIMVFKIVVICILCITKFQKTQLQQVSTVIAFTLAVFSQLLQIVIDHIHDNLLSLNLFDSETNFCHTNGIDAKHGDKKVKTKIRRRRKNKLSSDNDSDVSDGETISEIDTNSEISGEGSADELISSSSDNESGDEATTKENKTPKIKIESKNSESTTNSEKFDNVQNLSKSFDELAEKLKKVNPITVLEIISEEKLLNSIKILCDWFISDIEIVKSCGKTTRSLLKQVVQLLNFLFIDFEHPELINLREDIKKIRQSNSKIVLPEDISLRGVEIPFIISNNYDWSTIYDKHISSKKETIIRIIKLISFGHSLVKIDETGITFDDKKKMFIIQPSDVEEVNGFELNFDDSGLTDAYQDTASFSGVKEESADNENKGQLTKMKHMGQLWLASEVRALENRVKSKTSLSPYLVLDVDSLIQSTTIVKHLVNSKKFIVIIPSAVVSALDDLKREKPEARDAIRWLELQFHQGNRFCRAQRPQERASLPFIKYPKKKDKEMFTYIQIIECCHYFAQQQKDASNLVTLLLGNENTLSNCENREISYTGLAHSAGINMEFVTNFYEKWRKNFKGKK